MLLLPRGILPSLADRLATRRGARARARAEQAAVAAMTALLEVEGLTKRFGGVAAVDAALRGRQGSVTALIGPNGSGKTTAFNLITGYLPADAGFVPFAGQAVRRPDPTRLARAGLARTFQRARVFSELSVRENLAVALQQPWRALPRQR